MQLFYIGARMKEPIRNFVAKNINKLNKNSIHKDKRYLEKKGKPKIKQLTKIIIQNILLSVFKKKNL